VNIIRSLVVLESAFYVFHGRSQLSVCGYGVGRSALNVKSWRLRYRRKMGIPWCTESRLCTIWYLTNHAHPFNHPTILKTYIARNVTAQADFRPSEAVFVSRFIVTKPPKTPDTRHSQA